MEKTKTITEVWDPVKTSTSPNGHRRVDIKVDPFSSRLVLQTDPIGIASEQYRLLRRSLNEQFPEGGVLLVTSPGKADGKTLNAVNLAFCLAEEGMPTLLLEIDLRQPSMSEILDCKQSPGVEAAFLGQIEPSAAVQSVNGTSLHIATVGKAQKDPVHLLKAAGLKKFMDWARRQYRWVILDAPPVLPAADVAELSPFSDAVFLVVRVRSTPRELVQRSIEQLGGRLHGVILNEATLCWDSYYRYLSAYHSHEK